MWTCGFPGRPALAWSSAKFDEGLKLVDPLKKKFSSRNTIHKSDLVHCIRDRFRVSVEGNECGTTLEKKEET